MKCRVIGLDKCIMEGRGTSVEPTDGKQRQNETPQEKNDGRLFHSMLRRIFYR